MTRKKKKYCGCVIVAAAFQIQINLHKRSVIKTSTRFSKHNTRGFVPIGILIVPREVTMHLMFLVVIYEQVFVSVYQFRCY